MSEFVSSPQKHIKRGKPIMVTNNCPYPLEIGTGIIFKDDGVYTVEVTNTDKGKNIIVKREES